ncbi:MAG: hypothetical protein U0871_18755 [Gemmataceae bacterium]
MNYAVRCPSCREPARVGVAALGRRVACPTCGTEFVAAVTPAPPAFDDIPIVPPAADPFDPGHDVPPATSLTPTLLGLALLPLGIPMLWVAGPVLTGKQPIFSFAAPVAVALGLCGLGVGVGLAYGWGHATRVRAVLALALVGYFTGGFLYFIKKEWAEAVRRDLNPGPARWEPFRPPGAGCRVELPGRAVKADISPLPGWPLTAYRCQPPGKKNDEWAIGYQVAHGPTPAGLPADDWTTVAREAVLKAADGADLTAERAVKDTVVGDARCDGHEFRLTLADGATNRIVRVLRHKTRPVVYYLAVEGTFLPADAEYVRRFFESFAADPR